MVASRFFKILPSFATAAELARRDRGCRDSSPVTGMSRRFLARRVISLKDRVQASQVAREFLAIMRLAAYGVKVRGRWRSGGQEHTGDLFCAARLTKRPVVRRLIRSALAPCIAGRRAELDVAEPRSTFVAATDASISSALLLKEPGPDGEKGVLLLGMEMGWSALERAGRGTRLFEDYNLVILSSWSPPQLHDFARLVGYSSDPIYVGISNRADDPTYELLAPTYTPIPLMACDWLDPAEFRPSPRSERDVDILMVANYAAYKRHWLLFEALRGMRRDLRVVLLGGPWEGRTIEHVKAEIRAFGVKQEIELPGLVPIQQVYGYMGRASVSVIFTRREGACVAVAESLFSDTPVGMMRDAHIGSHTHINSTTGVLFDRRQLSGQLARFLEARHEFSPRSWAVENISCHRSTTRLNEILRTDARRRGRPWTRDIAPLFWRCYTPHYFDPCDARTLGTAAEELYPHYGFRLIPPTDGWGPTPVTSQGLVRSAP
ncbi:Glycosyl transferases group 1 [Singulisphaera sp. GP187]|uniref:glycosyltransferase n=1 Tax=Singulisphaera sp. GP187 TaxID=1882752 RepID=UPI00092BA56D|nr:glycosyltransferase [Singulisphaera sp. GP187]SIO61468.1 Glycosyl transferases group 1 [Singulisphaera sp. GP187]